MDNKNEMMKVSNIDEDFVDIIDILVKNGFRPFASCDGVKSHHAKDNQPLDAYIAFLESPRILELLSAFKRDNLFDIRISNSTYKEPYELYDNIIEGNQYSIHFLNFDGEYTNYFKRIIEHVIATKEFPIDPDIAEVKEAIDKNKDTDFHFMFEFNSKFDFDAQKCNVAPGLVLNLTSKVLAYSFNNLEDVFKEVSSKYGIPMFDSMNIKRQETALEKCIIELDKHTYKVYSSDIQDLIFGVSKLYKIENNLVRGDIIDYEYDYESYDAYMYEDDDDLEDPSL